MAYHIVSRLFSTSENEALRGISAAKGSPKTLSGYYRSEVLKVIKPLQGKAIDFAVLLLHRLVEEYRWAVVLAEIETGTVHMTETPWRKWNPDLSRNGHDIRAWSSKNRSNIMRNIANRRAKTGDMERELKKLIEAVSRTESWLENGMKILAKHIEELNKIGESGDKARNKANRPSRGQKIADIADPFFNAKPPGVSWKHTPLFSDNPDAELRTLEEMMHIYSHGSTVSAMRPLRISDENWRIAKLLDIRIHEMRSRSPEYWSESLVEAMDKAESPQTATFQTALDNLIHSCIAALNTDEKILSEQWESLRQSGHPDAVPESLKKIGVRKTKKRGKAYWKSLQDKVKATDFTKSVLTNVKRYKRDKLGRFTK